MLTIDVYMNNIGDVPEMKRKTKHGTQRKDECIQVKTMDDGRDELNLSDFPFAALSDRVAAERTSLVFEDTGWDKLSKEMVQKRVIISPSVEFGLPTNRDEEVILGLMQFGRADGFSGRTISFIPSELFRLLGWRKEGRSYSRLDESLRRWVGVTLYCERAWWDEAYGAWVDKHFHLLEDVSVTRPSNGKPGLPHPWSVTWSEVLFRSFSTGYLRQLDLGIYRALKLGSSKRMYRFLDRRFHFGSRQVFDLRAFACERIGFSRTSDNSELKRRLDQPIRELESVGFLTPMTKEERYRRVRRGSFEIVFLHEQAKSGVVTEKLPPLEEALVARRVKQQVAVNLVGAYPGTLIEEKIDAFDKRMRSGGGPPLKNPPGFLVKSITDDFRWGNPVAAKSKNGSQLRTPPPKYRRKAICHSDSKEDLQAKADSDATRDYVAKLSPEDLDLFQTEALSEAEPLLREGYRRSLEEGSEQLSREYLDMIRRAHVRKILGLKPR